MRANECLCFCAKRNNFYPNELNEVVISDSKFVLAKEKSGKVKITSEELSKKSGQSCCYFSTVAGLEINGNQSAGKNLGYYIRGGRQPLF
jgi:vitamin B12 transporter